MIKDIIYTKLDFFFSEIYVLCTIKSFFPTNNQVNTPYKAEVIDMYEIFLNISSAGGIKIQMEFLLAISVFLVFNIICL